MVTTNQKPITDTWEIKKEEIKYNIKETYQNIGEESNRIREEQRRTTKQPENNFKRGNKYILIHN